jgi:hypothetical protein
VGSELLGRDGDATRAGASPGRLRVERSCGDQVRCRALVLARLTPKKLFKNLYLKILESFRTRRPGKLEPQRLPEHDTTGAENFGVDRSVKSQV